MRLACSKIRNLVLVYVQIIGCATSSFDNLFEKSLLPGELYINHFMSAKARPVVRGDQDTLVELGIQLHLHTDSCLGVIGGGTSCSMSGISP